MANQTPPVPPASAPQVNTYNPGGDGIIQNPSATSLANFINDSHNNGFGNIDPNIVTTIGQSMGNNAGAQTALVTIKNGLAVPNKTSQYLYEQSAMSPTQTVTKAVQDHIINTGLQTLHATSIAQLQQHLLDASAGGIKGAYDVGLPANGVWNNDWNNVLFQYHQDQLAKPGIGTFSARNVFNTFFGESWLSHAIPLVASVVKSIPGDVLKGLGDGFKLTTDAYTSLENLVGNKTVGAETRASATDIANHLANAGRITEGQKTLTNAEYANQSNATSLLNIASAAMALSTIGKLGEGAVGAVKGGIDAGKAAGATSVGKSLVQDLGAQKPEGIANWIMNSVLPETATGNRLAFTKRLHDVPSLAFTKWLYNVPAVKGLVNGLDKVATEGHQAYTTLRAVAATPYRLPIVGIAGKIAQDTSVAGIKLGLQGHAENWMGDPNGTAAYSLDHLKPISGNLGAALNIIQLGAHAPAWNAGGPSFEVGQKIANIHQQLSDALNSTGVISGYERGTGANFLDEVDRLSKAGVQDAHAVRSQQLSSKYIDAAAMHSAQAVTDTAISKGVIDATNADQRLRYLQNAQSAIRNNPTLLEDALQSYAAKPMTWETDLAKEMQLSQEDARTALGHGLENQTKAQLLFKEHILPNLDKFTTPASLAGEDTSWMSQGLNDVSTVPEGFTSGLMTPEDIAKANKEASAPIATNQTARIQILMKNKGIADKESRLAYMTKFLQRDIKSTKDLTSGEADRLIKNLVPKTPTLRDAQNASLRDAPLPANFGLSRIETLHANDVQGLASQFYADLEKAKPGFKAPETLDNLAPSSGEDFGAYDKASALPKTFDKANATSAEMKLRVNVEQILGTELGRNIRDLQYVPTQDLIKLMVEKSTWLASDAHLPSDGSLDEINKMINDLGYKINYGTDVGHNWTDPTLSHDLMGESRNAFQAFADKLGLNMAQSDPALQTQAGRTAANKTMQEAVAKIAQKPNNTLPPWATGSRLMSYVQDIIKPTTSGPAKYYMGLMNSPFGKVASLRIGVGSVWKEEVDKLIGTTVKNLDGSDWKLADKEQAGLYIKTTIASANTPQTWLKKDWMEAMTAKGDDRGMILNNKGFETQAVGLSTKEASDLWYAMQKGLRSTPHYISGINPLSRLLNSSFGLANVPLAINGHRILDLTGKIQPSLINLRYSYSPLQAWLRVAKSAVKGVNENMPISYNPYESLKELGPTVEANAYALADKVFGADKNAQEVADFTNKEFDSKDLANIYNPRATLARTVHYVAENMKAERGLVNKIEPNALETNVKLSNQAKQFDSFEDFSKAISLQGLRPRAWHITKDENFKPDVNVKPLDRTGSNPDSVLYVGDPSHWQEYANGRNHVVEYDLSNLKWTGNPLKDKTADFYSDQSGNQGFVIRPSAYGKLKETGRMTVQEAINRAEQQSKAMPNSKQEAEKLWNDTKSPKSVSELTPADYPELKSRVDAINNYGNRTAAEKSVNAFFFPFSFEKTVVRELGGALLDNPSLRMMTASAIAAYNSSDGQKIKAWMEANLPLFKEAEKLNPYYHGFGLGSFGGINKTPYSVAEQFLYGGKSGSLDGVSDQNKLELFLHMVMPKPITTKASAVAMLALVPALKDLSTNVIGYNPSSSAPSNWGGVLRDTARTLWWEAGSAITKLSRGQITGHANTDNWQVQDHLPYAEQQTKAWDLRSKIITFASQALNANRHGGQFAWPDNFPKGFAGVKVDMTSLNQIVHHVYPAYDPTKAFTAVATKQVAVADERSIIASNKTPNILPYFNAFVTQSDKLQAYIQKNSLAPNFDPAPIAPYMDELRQAAAKLASHDATFPAFYAKYYASKYGPLKGL